KVERLHRGSSYVIDVTDSDIESAEMALYSSDPAVLQGAHIILICVPTPLTDHTPDLSLLREAAEQVGRNLRAETLVVLKSTTYPGATEEVVRPILEAGSGLTAGEHFALAYSP